MKNEEVIEKIVSKEAKVSNLKTYLRISFFLVSLAVIIIAFMTIKNDVGEQNDVQDSLSGVILLVTYMVYAVLLFAGWFWNRYLSKKLDQLWKQKKLLF